MRAVDAGRDLHPVQMADEVDGGLRRPVRAGTEVGGAVAVPVPGADDRLGRPHLERLLHRSLVEDRVVEGEDDRHAHPVRLLIPLEDGGVHRLGRHERPEPAGLGHRAPGCVDRRGAHRVAARRAQRLAELPDGGRSHQMAAHVRPAPVQRDAGQASAPHGDRDRPSRLHPPAAVGRGDREVCRAHGRWRRRRPARRRLAAAGHVAARAGDRETQRQRDTGYDCRGRPAHRPYGRRRARGTQRARRLSAGRPRCHRQRGGRQLPRGRLVGQLLPRELVGDLLSAGAQRNVVATRDGDGRLGHARKGSLVPTLVRRSSWLGARSTETYKKNAAHRLGSGLLYPTLRATLTLHTSVG